MQLLTTPYSCFLSHLAFTTLCESLTAEQAAHSAQNDKYVAFIDGDCADNYNLIEFLYGRRKEKNNIYIITLSNNNESLSPALRHLSDFVVDKKINYQQLKMLVAAAATLEPKALIDEVFGDIVGDMLKSSRTEQRVMALILSGHSQTEIANMLHLSPKTISRYKVQAVKRSGARSFNEMFMQKFGNSMETLNQQSR